MTKIVTFNRTIESLYEELVKEGILVQYPKVKIADYMGEYRFTDNKIYCFKDGIYFNNNILAIDNLVNLQNIGVTLM